MRWDGIEERREILKLSTTTREYFFFFFLILLRKRRRRMIMIVFFWKGEKTIEFVCADFLFVCKRRRLRYTCSSSLSHILS